jgi:hypothetical protein
MKRNAEFGPCIYCRAADGPFIGQEHPLPEGLGNTRIVLPRGVVCDPCNNGPLSRVDDIFVNFLPVAVGRVLYGVRTKAGAFPRANLDNASFAYLGQSELALVSKTGKGIRPKSGGLDVELRGRRLTDRYLVEITRFFHKAALGLLYVDHGRDLVLEARFDEVREIVRGAPFHGYLMGEKQSIPRPEVSFTYQFVKLNGQDTVMTEANVYGVRLATDLLIREVKTVPESEDDLFLLRF